MSEDALIYIIKRKIVIYMINHGRIAKLEVTITMLANKKIRYFVCFILYTPLIMDLNYITIGLSRYFGAVRLPPQDSERNKEDRWESYCP